MEILNAYTQLKENKVASNYIDSEDYILTHASLILSKNEQNSWEFGFFNKKTNKITVFETDPIIKREEDDVLKEENTIILPINFNNIKISYDEASKIADHKLISNNIKLVTKKIIILKNSSELTWNLTYMTQDFKLVNIKISAITGEISHFESYSVFDLGLQKA